jgi:hypothetical protein
MCAVSILQPVDSRGESSFIGNNFGIAKFVASDNDSGETDNVILKKFSFSVSRIDLTFHHDCGEG